MWTHLVYQTVGHRTSFSSSCCVPRSRKWHQVYSEDKSWSPGRNPDNTDADGLRPEGDPAESAAIKGRGEPRYFQRCSGETLRVTGEIKSRGAAQVPSSYLDTHGIIESHSEKSPKKVTDLPGDGSKTGFESWSENGEAAKENLGSRKWRGCRAQTGTGSPSKRDVLEGSCSACWLVLPRPLEEACLPAYTSAGNAGPAGVFPAKGRPPRGFPPSDISRQDKPSSFFH